MFCQPCAICCCLQDLDEKAVLIQQQEEVNLALQAQLQALSTAHSAVSTMVRTVLLDTSLDAFRHTHQCSLQLQALSAASVAGPSVVSAAVLVWKYLYLPRVDVVLVDAGSASTQLRLCAAPIWQSLLP